MNVLKLFVVGMVFLMLVIVFVVGVYDGGYGYGVISGEFGKVLEVSWIVIVEMYDNYYEFEEISVKLGEIVCFVVENKGNFVYEFNVGIFDMYEVYWEEMMMMVEYGVI